MNVRRTGLIATTKVARIWKGLDKGGSPVVMKEFYNPTASQSAPREARALQDLDGAGGAPRFFDWIPSEREVYMEFVPGSPLHKWVRTLLTSENAFSFFAQLGERVAEAHALDYVHADLSSSNVLVSNGCPRIIDWGGAHRGAEIDCSLIGTRGFCAPERMLRLSLPAGDVFSLGSLLDYSIRHCAEREWVTSRVSELCEHARHPMYSERPSALEFAAVFQ